MKKICRMAILIPALSALALAETVNIFGKVTDTTTGVMLDNVIVKLKAQSALIDTTGVNGVFLLAGETAGIFKGVVAGTTSHIGCSGSSVFFSVRQKTDVSIELFNTLGQRIARPFSQPVESGSYRIPIERHLATQLLLIRVTCGSDTRVFRLQGGMTRMNTRTRGNARAGTPVNLSKIATAAPSDTLLFSRSGYVTKKLAIPSYVSTDTVRVALKQMLLPRVMRKINGGTFPMGIANTADTVHSVTVSSFYIDSTEVTQADYYSITGRNPAIHANNLKKPVENVTWFDAILYCNAISKREGFDTAYTYASRRDSTSGACVALTDIAVDIKKKGYRMPTGAEWEYAARGGSTGLFSWGNDSTVDSVGKYAWFIGNLTADSTPQAVATKKPNGYGLYDMAGNVWEYCTDEWTVYGSQAQTDPFKAPAATINLKGGDYLDPATTVIPGQHTIAKSTMAKQRKFFGFRVVIPPVYADSELSYMSMVGVTIAAAKDSQVNAWYDTTHIPLLMKYAGLKQAYRFRKTAPVDSLTPGRAGYWATYMYPTKGELDGMKTSAEFSAAITEMNQHWTAGECSTKVAVDYQRIKSWTKSEYTGELNYLWIVRAEFTAGKEAAVNEWYNDIHVPLILKYPGVKKVVRYQKVGSSGDINAASMTTYLAFYYFPAQADYDSMTTSKQWVPVQDNLNEETIDSDMKTAKSFKMQLIRKIVK